MGRRVAQKLKERGPENKPIILKVIGPTRGRHYIKMALILRARAKDRAIRKRGR